MDAGSHCEMTQSTLCAMRLVLNYPTWETPLQDGRSNVCPCTLSHLEENTIENTSERFLYKPNVCKSFIYYQNTN